MRLCVRARASWNVGPSHRIVLTLGGCRYTIKRVNTQELGMSQKQTVDPPQLTKQTSFTSALSKKGKPRKSVGFHTASPQEAEDAPMVPKRANGDWCRVRDDDVMLLVRLQGVQRFQRIIPKSHEFVRTLSQVTEYAPKRRQLKPCGHDNCCANWCALLHALVPSVRDGVVLFRAAAHAGHSPVSGSCRARLLPRMTVFYRRAFATRRPPLRQTVV